MSTDETGHGPGGKYAKWTGPIKGKQRKWVRPIKLEGSSPRGRPTGFNEVIAREICEWVANGGTLTKFCRREGTPNPATIYDWLTKYKEFNKIFYEAKQNFAHTIVNEINDIADDNSRDGENDAVARDRLRIEARKWVAGKVAARHYGDRIHADVSISPLAGILALIDGTEPQVPGGGETIEQEDGGNGTPR